MSHEIPEEVRALLGDWPRLAQLEVLLADINGIIRGKRLPLAETATLFSRGINLSASAHLLDMRGRNVEGLGLGTDDGDPDFICRPVPGTVSPVPWSDGTLAQCLISMYTRDGQPYFAEGRHVLAAVRDEFAKQGLTPVVAIELEFYLLADRDTRPPELCIGRIPGTRTIHDGPQLYNVEDLQELDPFLRDLAAACRLQRIPATTVVSECAPGQFEVNLHHVGDAVQAADHAVLLRRAIRSVARRHGMAATFMAKPFEALGGSGTHIHVSLLDRAGRNVFAPGAAAAGFSPALAHAAAGLLAAMPESMAIFAPNANSYRRLRPGTFAPIAANWGRNHRNVSVRIPLSEPADTRLEHRVAGADANPYLATAAVLAGMHHGLTQRLAPTAPLIEPGDVVVLEPALPNRWEAALDAFGAGAILPGYLGREFCRVYAHCRRTEAGQFHAQVSDRDYDWYLRVL